jgi:hypothetical protein
MSILAKSAGYAALVIGLAFAMHNLNGAYIEPEYLGFASYADYADLGKLMNASRAWPWLLSGLGHVASGFAMVILTLGAYVLYRESRPAAALIALGAGLLAAAGFLLLGLSHVIGRQTLFLLTDANPGLRESAYMTATIVRIYFNGLAQVGLGWFAVQLSWCGLKTATLPRLFCWYGYLSGAAGLLMAIAYIPVYLFTVLVWALWLGAILVRRPPVGGRDAAPHAGLPGAL